MPDDEFKQFDESQDPNHRSVVSESDDPEDSNYPPGSGYGTSLDPDRRGIAERDATLRESESLAVEHVEGEVLERISPILSASVSRSGPLPEVDQFAGYEQVLPGAAERILAMAEVSANAAAEATLADAEATRAAAASVLEDAKAVRRGQYLFGLLVLLSLGAAVWLGSNGQSVPAIGLTVFAVFGAIGMLIRPVNSERWRPER